jgi:alginate O-acetyltransferase complex protein AlgI
MALTVHKLFRKWNDDDVPSLPPTVSKVINVLITFHFVCFCWIFFRASSMESAMDMINQMLYHLSPQIIFEFFEGYKAVCLLMIIGFIMHFIPAKFEWKLQQQLTDSSLAFKAAFVLVIIVIIVQTKSAGIQPFIYFQF